jgi:hypothetical protein
MSIHPKYQPLLLALLMTVLMGLVLSTTMTLANVGYGTGFWRAWWGAMGLSNLIGIPLFPGVRPASGPAGQLAYLTPAIVGPAIAAASSTS